MILVTCSICGQQTADKVVLRDDYGQICMTTPAPVVMQSESADQMHGMVDRYPGCSVGAECKDCRDMLRREQERELAELCGEEDYY